MHCRHSPFRRRTSIDVPSAPGFTLLEVILALVVLGAALAMLGEIMRLANLNAVDARAESRAQLLANSLMDEILAGYVEAADVQRKQLEVDDGTPWLYSIVVGTSDFDGVLPVEVVVEQDLDAQFKPARFRLLRWLPTVAELPETGAGAAGGVGGAGATNQGTSGGGPPQ